MAAITILIQIQVDECPPFIRHTRHISYKCKPIRLSNEVKLNIARQEDSPNAPLPVANEEKFNMLYSVLMGKSTKQGFKSNKEGN